MIAALLDDLRAVTIRELDTKAALRDRHDNKYLLPEPALWSLLGELGGTFHVLQVAARRTFSYDSVYFDSDALMLHRAHVQGRRLRYKIRTRTYGDGLLCFAEIKLKGPRSSTIKVRRQVPLHQHGHVTADLLGLADHSLQEHYGHRLEHRLRPTASIKYERATLVHVDGGERVTIDRLLQTCLPDGTPTGRLRTGMALIEVKTHSGRGVADAWLHRRHRRPVALSKYGVAMALARPGTPHPGLNRVLTTGFVPSGASSVTATTSPAMAIVRAA